MIRKLFLVVFALYSIASLCEAGDRKEFEKTQKDEIAKITQRLRLFHAGFSKYMKDNAGVWPQPPKKILGDAELFLSWWQDTLEPYGVPEESWIWEDGRMGFMATSFDRDPLAAFKWSGHPWILTTFLIGEEQASFVILPEGQIRIMPFDKELFPKHEAKKKASPAKVPKELEALTRR